MLKHGLKLRYIPPAKICLDRVRTAQDLAKIEPATLFRLANNPKKYQSVIDQLLTAPEINQQTVRDLIALSQQPKEPKQELPSIWRRTKDGRRYCQIPPIHETDDRTGTTLQKMMDEEGMMTYLNSNRSC